MATRTTVISIKGHMDLAEAIGLKEFMERLPGEVTGIVLDLLQMRYTYSVCAGYLLETPLNRKMTINIVAKGKTYSRLKEFVAVTKLTNQFHISFFNSIDDAIEALGK